MARLPAKTSVSPEKFKSMFPTLKPTIYSDPSINKSVNKYAFFPVLATQFMSIINELYAAYLTYGFWGGFF